MRAGVLQEIKRRRRYESKTDEKKREAPEARRRNCRSQECIHLWELLECSICDPRIELCRLAGFSVQVSESSSAGVDDTFCYGGKASLDSISDSWTSSKDRPTLSGVASWDAQDFQRWAREMPVSERVMWAIGGMVLTGTAGLIFISKRKSYGHRQKQAGIVCNMRLRRLDSRVNSQQTKGI
ncbi:hypothetical protein Zm00014a_039943 [Zea mays]|uniref:Uncharacterized protein n=1 Tax=Zea mays TaxID=4577 RepID=A0A3L6ESA1_MAIZE|nr:hypothetical protein Zm00014a_039943 [Zea mays]